MSDDAAEDDLATVAGELADTLRELRRELDREPPPRGPGGLPRPPSPREFLRFADEVAIPATIAILEANIKLLETLQRAIRLADRERELRERSRTATDRATELSADTVDRVDEALSDLQQAIEDGPLPDNETARDVLTQARSLRNQLDERVRDASRRADEARDAASTTDVDVSTDGVDTATASGSDDVQAADTTGTEDGKTAAVDGSNESEETDESAVDVDSELEYLKDKYGDDPSDDGEMVDDENVGDDTASESGDDDND